MATIGDPEVRMREDPVRALRAVRFASRLGFAIAPDTFEAMRRHAGELARCAPARVLEEIFKLLRCGGAARAFALLKACGALPESCRRWARPWSAGTRRSARTSTPTSAPSTGSSGRARRSPRRCCSARCWSTSERRPRPRAARTTCPRRRPDGAEGRRLACALRRPPRRCSTSWSGPRGCRARSRSGSGWPFTPRRSSSSRAPRGAAAAAAGAWWASPTSPTRCSCSGSPSRPPAPAWTSTTAGRPRRPASRRRPPSRPGASLAAAEAGTDTVAAPLAGAITGGGHDTLLRPRRARTRTIDLGRADAGPDEAVPAGGEGAITIVEAGPAGTAPAGEGPGQSKRRRRGGRRRRRRGEGGGGPEGAPSGSPPSAPAVE